MHFSYFLTSVFEPHLIYLSARRLPLSYYSFLLPGQTVYESQLRGSQPRNAQDALVFQLVIQNAYIDPFQPINIVEEVKLKEKTI